MRVYIAGPISLEGTLGEAQIKANLQKFHDTAELLRDLGYHVENPAENPDTDPPRSWQSWMRLAITQLLTCDTVTMLPGWTRSMGAHIECRLAESLGIPTQSIAELICSADPTTTPPEMAGHSSN